VGLVDEKGDVKTIGMGGRRRELVVRGRCRVGGLERGNSEGLIKGVVER